MLTKMDIKAFLSLLMLISLSHLADSEYFEISSNSPTLKSIELPSNLSDDSAISIVTKIEKYFPEESDYFVEENTGSGDKQPTKDDETGVVKEGQIYLSTSFDGEFNFWSLNRTSLSNSSKILCFNNLNGTDIPNTLTVSAFAESNPVDANKLSKVDITAIAKDDFAIKLGDEVKTIVRPGSPQVFKFSKETSVDESYVLTVQSDDKTEHHCMYVGINVPGCPWNDHLRTVKNSRIWARMLKVGYFPITMGQGSRLKFGSSLVISLISLDNSAECYADRRNITSGPKHVTVKIEKSLENYALPVTTSVFSLIGVSVLLFSCWVFFWIKHSALIDIKDGKKKPNLENIEDLETTVNGAENPASNVGVSESSAIQDSIYREEVSKVSTDTEPCQSNNGPIVDENSYKKDLYQKIKDKMDEDPKLFKDKHWHALNRLVPEKEKITLSDMCQTIQDDVWHRRQRSKAYIYILPLVSLFYFIPSSQMVWHDKKRGEEMGSMEECYLNYGCSRPWWIFADFNHLISNFGYLWYGILFIILVRLKSYFLPVGNSVTTDHKSDVGIPQQHSLFYCMGIAMIFQGIFSFCFHICPTNVSLQFDTTMMYVMMTLCFVKIYQFRHPDTATNAYACMYTIAAALILEAFSVYIAKGKFLHSTTSIVFLYSCFGFLYIFLILALAVDVYYYGAIKTNIKVIGPIIFEHSILHCDTRKFLYPRRFFYSIMFCVFNVGLLFYTIIKGVAKEDSLSSPLLLIFAFNMAMYFGYYMFRKLWEIQEAIKSSKDEVADGENIKKRQSIKKQSRRCLKLMMRLFSFLFFIFAFILMVFAGYFYANKRQSRNLSPPESRNKNLPCAYMDFFDEHDMWHFLSATALFVACVGLLTIDDDLLRKKRKNIEVF